MPAKLSPFELHFEIIFLENYSPPAPSLNVHKAKNVKGKYAEEGNHVFIAYASKNLRLTFEYGPEPGMIALRNCGHHESCERDM